MGPVFKSYFLGHTYIAEGRTGMIDSVYRRFDDTARSLYKQFGNKLPDEIVKAADKEPFRRFELLHIVDLETTHQVELQSRSLSYQSMCMQKAARPCRRVALMKCRISSAAGRKTLMEVYGRGPGIEALPDVRMINEMERVGLIATKSRGPTVVSTR